MPIEMDDFREPKWTRYRTRYPISENKSDRFVRFDDFPRSYRGGEFKQAGYEPAHNSTRIEKINLRTDDFSFRAR